MANVKKLSNIEYSYWTDELMGLTVSELNEVAKLVQDIKILKAKSTISVGDRVYVVQKTKKTPGTVRKINKSRAIVDMVVSPITGETAPYNVPFSMIQSVKEAA